MRPSGMFMHLMVSAFHLLLTIDSLSSAAQSLCHSNESSALLQFKERLSIDNPNSYSKIMTWKLEGEGEDCCTWDGVECDAETGYVIGLDISSSFLVGLIDNASTLFSLIHLRRLNLAFNNFNYSQIPSEISNLSSLSNLNLSASMFSGMLPDSLGNLTELTSLDLSQNQLADQIPSSVSDLKNLEFLDLSYNYLSGTVHADIFLSLRNLSQLHLSENSLSFLTNNTKNYTSLPMLSYLGLDSCNLSEFPDFLRFQEKLEILTLVNNSITQIPEWMRNGTARGSDQQLAVIPWPSLRIFDLRDNMLQGSIPIPPTNITGYLVSNNRLTGDIPPLICDRKFLTLLDLSNNSMSGTIPPCLSKLGDSLDILNLKGNKFSGAIPQPYTNRCNLKMVDLSQNQLQGMIPPSLANCEKLEILILAENQIQDNFPIWLAVLPGLQVLLLRSNNFHGAITTPTINTTFPKMRIIDLSNNSFTGNLPLDSSQSWDAMKVVNVQKQTYMTSRGSVQVQNRIWSESYGFSMILNNRGVEVKYDTILNILTAIDLSSNQFSGEIPESIGNLQGIQLLDLSNNQLTGVIPVSVANLMQLESLDLSRNNLSGTIPLQLPQLSFLAFFNVSFNRLVGRIPQGNQFNSYQSNSYIGNLALCGYPLSRICGGPEASPSPPAATDGDEDGDDDSDKFPSTMVDWVVILTGVCGGLVVGLILGCNLTTANEKWIVEKVGSMSRKWESSAVQRQLKDENFSYLSILSFNK